MCFLRWLFTEICEDLECLGIGDLRLSLVAAEDVSGLRIPSALSALLEVDELGDCRRPLTVPL